MFDKIFGAFKKQPEQEIKFEKPMKSMDSETIEWRKQHFKELNKTEGLINSMLERKIKIENLSHKGKELTEKEEISKENEIRSNKNTNEQIQQMPLDIIGHSLISMAEKIREKLSKLNEHSEEYKTLETAYMNIKKEITTKYLENYTTSIKNLEKIPIEKANTRQTLEEFSIEAAKRLGDPKQRTKDTLTSMLSDKLDVSKQLIKDPNKSSTQSAQINYYKKYNEKIKAINPRLLETVLPEIIDGMKANLDLQRQTKKHSQEVHELSHSYENFLKDLNTMLSDHKEIVGILQKPMSEFTRLTREINAEKK